MAFLNVLEGKGMEERLELGLMRNLLGRHPSCQIIVDANAVSRQHAQIIWDGSDFLIEDLRSRNGTYVNNREITGRHLLGDGDLIKVCDYVFEFNRELLPKLQNGSKAGKQTLDQKRDGSRRASERILEQAANDDLTGIRSRLELSNTTNDYAPTISAEKRLQTLIEITKSLSGTLTLDEMLPRVLDSLFKIFVQSERGFIFLQEGDGPLIAEWYRTRDPKENQENLRVSRTVIRHVMENKEAILSADAAEDERFDMSHSIVSQHVRSIMCAPIINGNGESIGCIQIDTYSQKTRFDNEDLEVLTTVAMQTGIAIENARLIEQAISRREVERDLELAHEVQNGILPRIVPELSGYTFHNFYLPAHQIGGDYYDYVQLPDGRLAVLVADVVGHGISAALLMAKFSAEARFALVSHRGVGEAIEALNRSFSAMSFERFVTLVVAVIDPRDHSAVFVNAGHNPPLIRTSGSVSELPREISGMPLGIDENQIYSEHTVRLASNDAVIMYTDGVTESVDKNNEEYGMRRMENRILGTGQSSASDFGPLIVEDLHNFTAGVAFADDVCVACFSRTENR